MKAIVTNIGKDSAYAHCLGLTYNVSDILNNGNSHVIFSLLVDNRSVDFSISEVTIVDFQKEYNSAYENAQWVNQERLHKNYLALSRYAEEKRIKFNPKYKR